ncbi:hypothetical protein IFM89_024504 [Coptis chinensis]|uniref:Disease resistance N-terminal domain-containing protein n=1 Tax=Coptis chinensis TaxID=261450 RepID=A0A835H8J0_9MAGN|nr:hypothetical protein IFM89_024504 [Coptis chinensis]
MADVLVSPIVELLFSNLTSFIRTEFGSLYGVKKDLEKLSSTLDTVRSVLDDAETKQIKDKLIGDWLRKLKDAASEAENIEDARTGTGFPSFESRILLNYETIKTND